jgi:hypothetical protein
MTEDHTLPEPNPASTARVSIGGFAVRAKQRPSPAPPQREALAPQPTPEPRTGRPNLKLVSSTTGASTPPAPVAGPWRYWVTVAHTDGRTKSNVDISCSMPAITDADRRALADTIAAQLKRPVASVTAITPMTRPNNTSAEPEPDIPPRLPTSAANDPQPWHYRVHYVTDTGFGTCEVDRSEPIRSGDDVQSIQNAITSHNGHNVLAVESFSLLAAPAQPSLRSI